MTRCERPEWKQRQIEKLVEMSQAWVKDGDERRRDQNREKELQDAAGSFGVFFTAVTAQPRD